MGALSCNTKKDYNPYNQLSPHQIDVFKYNIARYIGRLPKHADEKNKHHIQFNEAYQQQARSFTLSKYYKDNSDTIFFEVNKLARSLKFKKVAVGGKMVLDKNNTNHIVFYAECYRTATIFNDFVHNKSLNKYYTENTNDDTHIEFPNQNTNYNIANRKWESTANTFHVE
jgi:hypothetical protein